MIKPGQIYKSKIGHLKVYSYSCNTVYYRYIDGPIKGNHSLIAHENWIVNHTKLSVFKTFKSLIKRNN